MSVRTVRPSSPRLSHTSLGEESAETLIGVLGLSLLCEVTIGLELVSIWTSRLLTNLGVVVYLDTVLEAVKLGKQSVRSYINKVLTKLTSQQELAIWQPACPTRIAQLASQQSRQRCGESPTPKGGIAYR